MVSHDQLCDAQELLFLALLASNLCNTFSSSIFEYEWNIWICKWYLRATEGKKIFVTQMLFSNTQSYFIYGLTRTWPLLLIAYYSHNLLACLSKIDLARIKIKGKLRNKTLKIWIFAIACYYCIVGYCLYIVIFSIYYCVYWLLNILIWLLINWYFNWMEHFFFFLFFMKCCFTLRVPQWYQWVLNRKCWIYAKKSHEGEKRLQQICKKNK